MSDITLSQAGIYAVLGYAVVFLGLILLLMVTALLGKCFSLKKKKPVSAPVAAPIPAPEAPKAPGTAGGVKLHGVEPKTAAMLMAIVADKLGKPLNELRFISIKEVEK